MCTYTGVDKIRVSSSKEAFQFGIVLPVSLEWALVDPRQVLGVGFVAHGGTDASVDGEGDGAGGADPVRDAACVLALLALGAVRVEGTHHVHGATAFRLPENIKL